MHDVLYETFLTACGICSVRNFAARATCLPLERGMQREARGARHLGVGELGRRAHHLDLDPGWVIGMD